MLSLGAVVSLFPVLLGGAVFGSSGAFMGLILSLLVIVGVAMTSEKTIAQIYGAHSQIPGGLGRSLTLISENEGRTSPRLLIYSDSYPNALVVREIGGRGSILMSQGMIALLNAAELREIMKICLGRLKEPLLIFQSLSSVFAVGVLRLIPRSWAKLVYVGQPGQLHDNKDKTELSPFSTFVFLILNPVVQFFLYTGALPSTAATKKTCIVTEACFSAVQKMGGLIPLLGNRQNHATASLSIIRF